MRHAVVVCEPRVDEETVASIAKMTAYDVRLRLGGVLPAILCWTSDLEEATRIQKALGTGTIAIDPTMVMSADRMPRVRRFVFGATRFRLAARCVRGHALQGKRSRRRDGVLAHHGARSCGNGDQRSSAHARPRGRLPGTESLAYDRRSRAPSKRDHREQAPLHLLGRASADPSGRDIIT